MLSGPFCSWCDYWQTMILKPCNDVELALQNCWTLMVRVCIALVIWQEFNHPPQNISARFMLTSMVSNLSEHVLCLTYGPKNGRYLMHRSWGVWRSPKFHQKSVFAHRIKKIHVFWTFQTPLQLHPLKRDLYCKYSKTGPPKSSKNHPNRRYPSGNVFLVVFTRNSDLPIV